MCNEIMEEVSGYRKPGVEAVLEGYIRYRIKREHYPGVIPKSGFHVDGIVYTSVPESAWRRLDSFEGELYQRQTVRVFLNNRNAVYADTYIIKPKYLHLLDDSQWSYQVFLESGKHHFQKQYIGYRSI